MKIGIWSLFAAGMCSAAVPLTKSGTDFLYEPNYQERNILIGNLKDAFPDSFAKANNEFDKKSIETKLAPICDSIVKFLRKKELIVKISGIEISEYNFDNKSFNISMGVIEIDPKFEEKLNAALSRNNRDKAKKTKNKIPEHFFFQSKMNIFDSKYFAFKMSPNSEILYKALNNYEFNQAVTVPDEKIARNIADWRESWKKSGYGSETKDGIYFSFSLHDELISTMGSKFITAKPNKIFLLDGNGNISHQFDFFDFNNTK